MCSECVEDVKNVPNKANLRKWVAALRSGDYTQGRLANYNQDSDSYCCLGVACHVAELSGVSPLGQGALHWRTRGSLIPAVRDWLGVNSTDPVLVAGGQPLHAGPGTASVLNDVDKKTFPEIADLIEIKYDLKDDDALEDAASEPQS